MGASGSSVSSVLGFATVVSPFAAPVSDVCSGCPSFVPAYAASVTTTDVAVIDVVELASTVTSATDVATITTAHAAAWYDDIGFEGAYLCSVAAAFDRGGPRRSTLTFNLLASAYIATYTDRWTLRLLRSPAGWPTGE